MPIQRFSSSGLLSILIISVLSGALVEGRSDKESELLASALKQFKVLPATAATQEFPATPERVTLGRMLFFDTRLSDDGTSSCQRCHLPSLYGVDSLSKSIGAHDFHTPRNAPTILNSALNVAIHWRGELKNVEEQAQRSLIGPAFANKDYATVIARIKSIPGYVELFKKAYPDAADPVSETNWGKAIGAYERTLLTPSRFDDYLGGKSDALTAVERTGLRLFIDTGCADCHNGVGVGGGAFEKFGVVEEYWKATGSQPIDQGRKDVTKKDEDQYVFKVAGLRNVAMTAPYFHDGSVRTLPEAVKLMGRVQMGKTLTDDETSSIIAFLKTLTGTLPKEFSEAPLLPPAGFGIAP